MNQTSSSRSNSIKAPEDQPEDSVQEQKQVQLRKQSESQGQTNPQEIIPAVIPESQQEQDDPQEDSHLSHNSNPLIDLIDKDKLHQAVTLNSEHDDNSLNQPPVLSENNTHRKSIYQIIEEEQENINDDEEAEDDPNHSHTEMAQLKRQFGDILQELQYLDEYFLELPSKMGHTLEHMRAVLDRRYQAMLKGFNNTHVKITELTAKLANIEYKISNNPGNKSLMRECAIYSEFARVLSVDLQVLSDCIISEDKTLKNIHQLYLQQHNTLLETNTQNLYTATLITRLRKYLKRYQQYYNHNNNNNHGVNDHHLNPFHMNNGSGGSNYNSAHLQQIERLCGASKLRIRNHSTLFVLKNYQKPAFRSTQGAFEKDKGSGIIQPVQSQQQSQTSQQFYSVQDRNQEEKKQMGKTASTAASGLPFKRNKELQKIRISVKSQGNRHFDRATSSNNSNQELKQAYFSQTDTLFMKKESIQFKQQDKNQEKLHPSKMQDDFDHEDIDSERYNHEVDAYLNANNNNHAKNIGFSGGASQTWEKQLEETESAVRSLKLQNQSMKTKLLGKVNSFYSSFELLKECLGSYQSYLEQSQRVVNSRDGLVGSLLFEISKLNVSQAKPVLHAFSQQSYKPSNLMDREARMVVYDTLKNMLDKQLNSMSSSSSKGRNTSLKGNRSSGASKNSNDRIPSITKNVFQSFTPLQVIGIMTLKPSSFEDVKFIMERKARVLQEKATKIQALSQQSSSSSNNNINAQNMYDDVQMMNE